MATMSQGNKKITTIKIPATNNKVLVCNSSLHFFKKYRQPIIKFWSVPVPVRETVRIKLVSYVLKMMFTIMFNDYIYVNRQTFIGELNYM